MWNSVDQDQSAHFVQSDLDLHCPQKLLASSSVRKELTLNHTIPTFNNLGKESFRKHRGKKRKCWLPAFSSFPTMFSKALCVKVVKSRDCVVKS